MTLTKTNWLLVLFLSCLAATQPTRAGPNAGGYSAAVERQLRGDYVEVFDDVESQLAIYPDDVEETASLVGPNAIYSDFCLMTRDAVMGDIKRTTASLATNVFSIFYSSFERLGLDRLRANQQETPPMDVQRDDSLMDSLISESRSDTTAATTTTTTSRFFSAVMRVLSSTREVLASSVSHTLQTIRSKVGLASVSAALQDACAKVGAYERQMRENFDKVQSQAVAAGFSGVLGVRKVEQLGCVTTDRVLRINGFCQMVKSLLEQRRRSQ